MNKNILTGIILLTIVILAISFFFIHKNIVETVKDELSAHEQLNEMYLKTINDPLQLPENLDVLDSIYVEYESIPIHTEAIRNYVYQKRKELDTINYELILREKEAALASTISSLEDLEKQKKEIEQSRKSLKDTLQSTTATLNEKILQKEQALKSNAKLLDSLVSSIQTMEASKKEVLNFKSPTGVEITYFGEVLDSKAHGQGVGLYANGNKYEGKWHNGQKHGEGVYSFPDGERYEGHFIRDKRDGWGKYYWPNGDIYSGYWKNDRRHGEGVIKDKKGKVISSGLWENDALIKMMKIDF